jgi:hypothetical protein
MDISTFGRHPPRARVGSRPTESMPPDQGVPRCCEFPSFSAFYDLDRYHNRDGETRVCRRAVRAILPTSAGLWLPAAKLPPALLRGNTRALSGRGARCRRWRAVRGNRGQCRARGCDRGWDRRCRRGNTPGDGAQRGRLLLMTIKGCRGVKAAGRNSEPPRCSNTHRELKP